MNELILKAIGMVGVFVLCGGLAFVLAYWTIKSLWDTPLLSVGILITLIAMLGWPRKKGQ